MDLLDPRVVHKERTHPSAAIYVRIAVVLVVLTALEVLAYEMARRQDLPGLFVQAVGAAIIPILVILSAIKFALVAMFYMHLKQDAKLFSGVFLFPIIIAVALAFALLLLFAIPQLIAGGH
jgi:caa(3)-type oxidase subunit IV